MSLWCCPNCGQLTAPMHGPCPKCGTPTQYAVFHPEESLPPAAAQVLYENLPVLYDAIPTQDEVVSSLQAELARLRAQQAQQITALQRFVQHKFDCEKRARLTCDGYLVAVEPWLADKYPCTCGLAALQIDPRHP